MRCHGIVRDLHALAGVVLVEHVTKAADFAAATLGQELCEGLVRQPVRPGDQLEVGSVPSTVGHDGKR